MWRRWLSLLLVASQPACSFIAMRFPSTAEGNKRAECTDTVVAPLVDLVPAIAGGVFSVWAIGTAATADCTGHEETCPGLGYGLGTMAAIPALVYGASAAYGFLAARACTSAKTAENR
jgi:hypothetical protein